MTTQEHTAAHPSDPGRKVVITEVATSSYQFPPRPWVNDPQVAPPAAQPKSVAELDPEYVTIGLPSQFAFYPFKTLSTKYLTGYHISKINRSQAEGKIQHLIEALSSALEPNVSAFDLTPSDFYYLMFWHRVNSYPKSPLRIQAMCQNAEHINKVKSNILPKETLDIVDVLNRTTLDVVDFKGLPSEMMELVQRLDLDVERMRDTVELSDHVLDSEDGDPEFVFLAGYAAFLRATEERKTLTQRVEIVKTFSPDTLSELDEYIAAVTGDSYGVREYANLRCKECGASTRVQISLEAPDFLSKR